MRPICDIIPKVKSQLLRESTKKNLAISEHWDNIVDAVTARRTKVQGLKQKMLYVAVESPALMHELANFKKDAILHKVQTKYPDLHVRDIKFIIGK